MFFFLIIALVLFFAFSSGRYRHCFASPERDRTPTAELEQVIEDQRLQIEWLEERVMRLEEGLEFAERMLAGGAGVTEESGRG
ncbi:MAG TPA: hypothetical protein VFU00_00380 [Gemmatimonadales bacterium]|nr:hypothetical protein [Gemmatimonadales bacterium]